jgi:hypothetical protein
MIKDCDVFCEPSGAKAGLKKTKSKKRTASYDLIIKNYFLQNLLNQK